MWLRSNYDSVSHLWWYNLNLSFSFLPVFAAAAALLSPFDGMKKSPLERPRKPHNNIVVIIIYYIYSNICSVRQQPHVVNKRISSLHAPCVFFSLLILQLWHLESTSSTLLTLVCFFYDRLTTEKVALLLPMSEALENNGIRRHCQSDSSTQVSTIWLPILSFPFPLFY